MAVFEWCPDCYETEQALAAEIEPVEMAPEPTEQVEPGPCSVCWEDTDTAVAVQGQPEKVILTLEAVGYPPEEAADAVAKMSARALRGDVPVILRLCAEDAAEADMKVGLLPGRVPLYTWLH